MIIINGTIYDPKKETIIHGDLYIEGGKIKAIYEKGTLIQELELQKAMSATEKDTILDASNLCIAPGFTDVHVHFRDPGFTHKEDIITGSKAAAKGGFTRVVLMANTNPVVDQVETLSYILEKGATTGIHVDSCATVTKGLKGIELSPLKELKDAGAVGFTDDGIPIVDESMLRTAMEQAKELGVPISLHEEDPTLIKNSGINQGVVAKSLGLEGAPREAEFALTKRDLAIAKEIGCKINIQHISSKEAVELVRQAKKEGVDVHCEASPHHFALTEEAVLTKGTLAKMNPPLREEEDRLAIIEGLIDNTIDIIATDHAPHSREEKERPYLQAPSGIIGLETAFSLGIKYLVHKKHLSLMELIKKMSYHPALLYGRKEGSIQVGMPADLVIFHPEETWQVEEFLSKSANSPFIGDTLPGVIYYTICNGQMVYHIEENAAWKKRK